MAVTTAAAGVIAAPLIAFVAVLLVGRWLPKRGASIGILGTATSLALAVWIALQVAGGIDPEVANSVVYTFATGVEGAPTLEFGLLIDPLSALVGVIVALIATLVLVFSLGYMNDEGETGLPRYYAELSLFTFSMLAFVYASNLLMAFVFFELVGLCSYLLIGFWFREPGPASAAKKAFLVTRFGDYFFLIGTVAVIVMFGTTRFAGPESLPAAAADAIDAGTQFAGLGPQTAITVVALLILGGAIGKSAQFPLHTWLPDAMEGPTPVSALIHAATMVAAGVYLIARLYGFYALSPTALAVVALVGGVTALFAASMGVVAQELKQVLAYSTISQYGYMMLALGAGGYVAGVFHLTTHAMFKALLFLGAGAVIVATHHEENMWELGGLRSKLPWTYASFLAGSLALAGIVPFAGFWSKDEVLYEALDHGLSDPVLLVAYALGLLAVPVTGFYTFRMVRLTFHGESRSDHARDAHAVGWSMRIPMAVLAVGALAAGWINMAPLEEVGVHATFLHDWLDRSLAVGLSTDAAHYGDLLGAAGYEAAHLSPILPALVSLTLALVGAGSAWWLYREPREHTDRLGPLKRLLAHNYYQDEYQVWLARGLVAPTAAVLDRFDRSGIDGSVDGTSTVTLAAADRASRLQSGIVTHYLTIITVAVALLIVAVGLLGGWLQ
ncbi:NADH-quinone oxidoreductase subunit L [Halococcoides cellulosivorans]|uniref:NADH-quinone oxidoreductase subunit L n=1 Tax=Halococcoides cellulosivorans TaxID=1679096 RepID=A0A2R4WZY0_9EURY|nr:NADH-quinone oxidoreductase subunit L [Halococcoides cellulosivorans]AWB27087.1 NADH-quinone oxidoreductase subunit L [Halococcoides cellulosivorans]